MKIILYNHILCYFFLSISVLLHAKEFQLGIESISIELMRTVCSDKKKGTCIVGLITNQTGVDQKGNRSIDILQARGFTVNTIFVPEHGFGGILAERDVHDSVDKKTGIPIISLYGNGSGKMISAEHLAPIDCLMFDIQDSGMRHYTYISTLLNTMKIAAAHNKPFVVFDRPNPLGSVMEGPLVEPSLISFISIASIPLRHGMTIGELAHYFNEHILEKKVKLRVVKMSGYNRIHGFVGDLINQLSPNLRSLQSIYGYSFLGLLGEIEPFDVGVGTDMAFRCITLPESMHLPTAVWRRLQKILDSYGVKSFMYRHTNKKNKRMSRGLRLEFSGISDMQSFRLLIAMVKFFKKENISFSFSPSFNKAVGTKKVHDVLAGTLSEDLFFEHIFQELQKFHSQAASSFFYAPSPLITKVSMKILG